MWWINVPVRRRCVSLDQADDDRRTRNANGTRRACWTRRFCMSTQRWTVGCEISMRSGIAGRRDRRPAPELSRGPGASCRSSPAARPMHSLASPFIDRLRRCRLHILKKALRSSSDAELPAMTRVFFRGPHKPGPAGRGSAGLRNTDRHPDPPAERARFQPNSSLREIRLGGAEDRLARWRYAVR